MNHTSPSVFSNCGPDITEVSFLIPVPKVEALERQAARFGLTLGELLRRMIASYPDCPASELFPLPMYSKTNID